MSVRALLVGVGLSVVCAGARADVYASADLFSQPNAVWTWDSAGPNQFQPTGITLSSTFVLGLSLTSARSGYYIATFSQGRPVDNPGFYRLDDGASTLVHSLPFLSPAYAGLAPAASGNGYVTLGDSNWLSTSVPYHFFTVGTDGTFSDLGAVSTPGIADPEIKGLTRRPGTGVLYGYEQSTDKLVTIDETTRVATIVGSLGINAFAAGGMAFSADGSQLVLSTGNDTFYRVNPDTGAATLIGVFSMDPQRASALCLVPVPGPGGVVVLMGAAGMAAKRRRR